MKKIVKIMALVAAAAMGFTACQKDVQEDYQPAKKTVVVNFVAQSADTKTSVDVSGEAPVFAWGETETFTVLEQTDALAEAVAVTYTKEDGKAKIDAEFATNAGKSEYQYVTVYPEAGYVSATNIEEATLNLPAVQTMAAGSYDPAADLMVSKLVTTAAQPTEAQMLNFTRLAAVAKMTLKNFTLEAGDQVEQVIFTAEGKALAGTVTADLTDPHAFTAAAVVDNVTVNTTSATDVYFTVLPTALEAGNKYTVTVLTSKKLYIKQGTIGDGKSLTFEAGMVTRFGVNMTGVEPIDKWILVRDASTLKEGDVVAIVAKDYDKALSTKLYSNASETSTSAKRGLADITKIDNYLIGGEDLQKLTLVTGTVDGTFSFYDETRMKFLVSTTTGSTYLINQVYCNDNTSFKITIDGTSTAATITNTKGDYAGNLLRYNTNGYFVSNQNSSSVYKDVCIYRLEGTVGTIPVVPANVTVPDSDDPVVIAEEGTAEATAIKDVVFNYVGDWTITPSTEAEWLNVAYDATKKCLTYTAEANTSTKRETSVTVTASLEGQESLTWTFNVLQKGAPTEISIEAFVKLSKDENQPYKLTGRVITLAENATTKGYVLDDGKGNQAQINYLDTETGDDVWGHDDDCMELKIGDIVTVTTYAMGSKKGGSSALPSIYKGHYRLTATSDKNLIDYTGGTVTVTLATEGNLQPADAVIKGEMKDAYDFVTLDYTEGASTATATFAANTGAPRNAQFNFSFGLASASVTVGQLNHPSVKKGWVLVTDASELAVGDKVIIAGKSPDETLDYAIKKYTSNTGSSSGIAISLLGNSINSVDGVEQFTLGSGHTDYADTWSFVCDSYSRYLQTNSSNTKITSTLDKTGSWTIEIAADGKATLTSKTGTSSSSKNTMMFNYTTSNQTFGAYTASTTGKGAIYIYKYYNE